ncbi:MAG: hypothetical protein VX278_19040 [Myxococcota bacterium]|nr:hypothetical protein [Myxococcota bacterium]
MLLILLFCSILHAEEFSSAHSQIDDFIEKQTNRMYEKRRWNHFINNPQNEWEKRRKPPKMHLLMQEKISQKDIHFWGTTHLYLLPNIIPASAQDMQHLLLKRSLLTGQLPQKLLENCDQNTVFPSSVLYTTGTYEVNEALLHCIQNVGFYPAHVSKITTTLRKKNTKRLFEITIDEQIDAGSIQNLLPYQGSVTILDKKVPSWLLEQIENVEWRELNLPNISKINAKTIKRLAYFRGSTLRLNGVKRLRDKEAKALQAFPVQRQKKGNRLLELKGLSSISPKGLQNLSEPGHAHLTLSLEKATPKHFSALRSRKITMLGVKNISKEMAQALQHFRGSLSFPDLETISIDTYLSLLHVERDALRKVNSSAWYTARNQKRKIWIPTTILPVTKEWVELRKDLHVLNQSSSNPYGMLKQWIEQAKTVDVDGLYAAQEKDKRFRGRPFSIDSLNGVMTLTPELAHFCAQKQGLNLDSLQSIDTQSLSILMNSPARLSLNGLRSISMEEAQIIAERASQEKPNYIHLEGLTHIEEDVLKVLSHLPYVVLPQWTFLYAFPARYLKDTRSVPFSLFSPDQFTQLDLAEREHISLQDVPNVTPKHIKHLAKYSLQSIRLHAWSLRTETIQSLLKWPHPQTQIVVNVNDAPMRSVVDLVSMNVQSVTLNLIHDDTPDLSFLREAKAKEVELFFDWMPKPIQFRTSHPITATKLTLSAVQHTNLDPLSLISILENFKGSDLSIDAAIELTPALAKSIRNRPYNLSIHIEDLQEDAEDEILSILRNPPKEKQYRLAIEGHLPICVKEYQHIQNEQCDIAEEMQRSLEYWENHDCSEEEDHQEHK